MATFWERAVISLFGFEGGIRVLVVPVPGHCIPVTFTYLLPLSSISGDENLKNMPFEGLFLRSLWLPPDIPR